jgi:hypothetical protein
MQWKVVIMRMSLVKKDKLARVFSRKRDVGKFKQDVAGEITRLGKKGNKLEGKKLSGIEKEYRDMRTNEIAGKQSALRALEGKTKSSDFKADGSDLYKEMRASYGIARSSLKKIRKDFLESAKKNEGYTKKGVDKGINPGGTLARKLEKSNRRKIDSKSDHSLALALLSSDKTIELGGELKKLNSAIKDRNTLRKRLEKSERKTVKRSKELKKLEGKLEKSKKDNEKISDLKRRIEKHQTQQADFKSDHKIVNQVIASAVKHGKMKELKGQLKDLKSGIKERDSIRERLELSKKFSPKASERISDRTKDLKNANKILENFGKSAEKGKDTKGLNERLSGLNVGIEFRDECRLDQTSRESRKNFYQSKLGNNPAGSMPRTERKLGKHTRLAEDAAADREIANNLMERSCETDADPGPEGLPKEIESFKKLVASRDKIRKHLSATEKHAEDPKWRQKLRGSSEAKLHNAQEDYKQVKALFDDAKNEDGYKALPAKLKELNEKIKYRDKLIKKEDKKNDKIKKLEAIAEPTEKDTRRLEDLKAKRNAIAALSTQSRTGDLDSVKAGVKSYNAQSKAHKKREENLNKKEKNLESNAKKHPENDRKKGVHERRVNDAKKDYELSRELIGKPEAKGDRKKLNSAIALRNAIRGKLDSNEKKSEKESKKVKKLGEEISKNEKDQKESNDATDKAREAKESFLAGIDATKPGADELKKSTKKEIEKLKSEKEKNNASFDKKHKNLNASLEKHGEKKKHYDKKCESLGKKYKTAQGIVENYPDIGKGGTPTAVAVADLKKVKKSTKEARSEMRRAFGTGVKPSSAGQPGQTPTKKPTKTFLDNAGMSRIFGSGKEAKATAPATATNPSVPATARKEPPPLPTLPPRRSVTIPGVSPTPKSVNITVTKAGVTSDSHGGDIPRTQALKTLTDADIGVSPITPPAVKAGFGPSKYKAGYNGAKCEVEHTPDGKVNARFGSPLDQHLAEKVLKHLAENSPNKSGKTPASLTIDPKGLDANYVSTMYQAARDAGIKKEDIKVLGDSGGPSEDRTGEEEFRYDTKIREREREAAEKREREDLGANLHATTPAPDH